MEVATASVKPVNASAKAATESPAKAVATVEKALVSAKATVNLVKNPEKFSATRTPKKLAAAPVEAPKRKEDDDVDHESSGTSDLCLPTETPRPRVNDPYVAPKDYSELTSTLSPELPNATMFSIKVTNQGSKLTRLKGIFKTY